ncbi:FRE family ferric-chelate reductase [Aspergillus heteromorphus CBS 117.55]|uniref:FRE family ferric-chelate reductase n=1 Tax=Aspergillus heteromorphus CBS 117.55 TaxID=1448321 RepID=A0A317V433_9EURO|nr:FRE family ferric-chelate reductase [Aspergillus heteromorphus CBS 117.55]PWY68399.1 FRE family ferric-chelate reductase [Aspergillus heteromorphus CBS 117.55]
MLPRSWLLFLASLALAASSNLLPANERCVTAVYTALGYISFAGEPADGFWETRCQNPLKVTSIYASSDIYCRPEEQTAGFAQLAQLCREIGNLDLIPREQLAENLTRDALQRLPVADFLEIPTSQRMPTPVLLSPSYYNRTFQTIDTWQFEVWSHYIYGVVGYGFWACILGVGIAHRFVQYIVHSRSMQAGTSSLARVRWLWKPSHAVYHWLQTHLVVSSPLPARGRRFFWWTFPTRIEAIATMLFWILSIILCTIGYRLLPGNIYWPDISSQILRYSADRTGVLSFANLPLVWLFAGRNNIFIWATGWSFATFNLFHRHIAWIATLQAVVHTLLYLAIICQKGNVARKFRKPYLLWGTAATVLMVLLLPFAVQWFRHRLYETFLFIHILFSVGLLVGCFYHTVIFEGHDYWSYLWPAVAIWILDRLLRIARLVYCNIHVRANSGDRIQYTSSSATYDAAADVIRLEVTPGASLLTPTPGDYYYLYQPFRITGWESHPFTLGSWFYQTKFQASTRKPPPLRNDRTVDVSQVPLLSDSSSGPLSTPDEMQLKHDNEKELRLVFWIRPYDGWTRSLRQQCVQSPDLMVSPTILLEGPYGSQFPLWNYESVLMIAGGTGIAAVVPYIQDHILRATSDAEETATHTRETRLVWVTRQASFVQQVAARELAPALARDDFRASFYSTAVKASTPRDGDGQTTPNDPTHTGSDLDILEGRPDVESLVLEHAHEAQLSESSAAVLVCGPSALADETRAAVHLAMRRGYRGIRYVEESFSWM